MKKIFILTCISFFLVSCASNKSSHSSNAMNKKNGVTSVSADGKAKKSKRTCKRSPAKTGSNLGKVTCKRT